MQPSYLDNGPKRLSPALEEEEDPFKSPTPPKSPVFETKEAKKRKSIMNPFKRSQTLDPSDDATKAKADKRKSSGGTIRRAFTSSNRPKSHLQVQPKGFDASMLPPSPIRANFPSAPPEGVQLKRRTSVFDQKQAPRLLNRESMLKEMGSIQDEESQRLTENAFLT